MTFEISKSSDWETIQPDIPYSFDIEHREFQYMKFPKGVAFPANLVGVSLFRLSEVGNSGVRSGLYDDYYLELNNWNAKDIVWTNPEWIEPPELNGEEIEIGQLINIPTGTADPISYRFELQEATEINYLRNRNGVFQRHSGAATVIASDGKERQLDSLETLFLDAGRYAIRVGPDGSLESSFQLLDVGEARTVRSDTWLDLPPGPERYELLRLEIEDGREHFLEVSGGGRAVFFDDPHGSLPYVLTKGGLVAIFTDAASRVGLVSVEGRTRTFELPDGSFSGEFFLGREVHRYRFRITEPGYYSVYARNAGSQPLELEPGISIPWRTNASLSQIVGETETLFSNVPDQPQLSFLPAGEFELKISTNLDYGVYEAGVEVVEFTDVAFGQTMMIEDGTNYRFQLDFEEGFVAARVADADGQSVPPQSDFLRNENRRLHPGPLEIINLQRQHLIWKSEFSGELNGPIQLRLSPLDASTSFSEAARLLPAMLNRRETVQLTALDYETVLRYTVPERDTVLLLRADLSPETQLHFRFVSASGDDVLPDWQDWSAFESQFWLDPESVLEIRFAGTGTSVLELGNLASAPAISSGVHPFTLPANYESRVWKLPDQVGTIVEFDADEYREETRWQILDAHGRVVRDFKQLPSLVIRDSGGYYLSMIRESPGNQPFTQTLSVQIVGPDERPG